MKPIAMSIVLAIVLATSISSCKKKNKGENLPLSPTDSLASTLTDPDLIKLNTILEPLRQKIPLLPQHLSEFSVWKQDSLWAELNDSWGSDSKELHELLASEGMNHRVWGDTTYSFYNSVDSLLRTAGMALVSCEGELFAEGALGFRLDLIKGIPEAARAWLELSKRESQTQMSNDGGFIVELDTIANWARAYEAYTKRYRTSSLLNRAEQRRNGLVSNLIGGADNTPPFMRSEERVELDQEFLKIWKVFAEKERKTKCGALIGEWYDLLESEGFTWTPACQQWVQAKELYMSGVSYIEELEEAPTDTAYATEPESSLDSIVSAIDSASSAK